MNKDRRGLRERMIRRRRIEPQRDLMDRQLPFNGDPHLIISIRKRLQLERHGLALFHVKIEIEHPILCAVEPIVVEVVQHHFKGRLEIEVIFAGFGRSETVERTGRTGENLGSLAEQQHGEGRIVFAVDSAVPLQDEVRSRRLRAGFVQEPADKVVALGIQRQLFPCVRKELLSVESIVAEDTIVHKEVGLGQRYHTFKAEISLRHIP